MLAAATATVTDDSGRYSGSLDHIKADAIAAFNLWNPFLAPSVGVIDIDVRLATLSGIGGNGGANMMINQGATAGVTLAEPGTSYELRTGRDPNGAVADLKITLNVELLGGIYWVNPLDGSPQPANNAGSAQRVGP